MSCKIKHLNNVSLRVKTVSFFIMFTVIILAVLWILQVLLFNTFYKTMKDKELRKITNDLVERYASDSYSNYVDTVAVNNDITILIFTENNGNFYMNYVGGRQYFVNNIPPQRLKDFVIATKHYGDDIFNYKYKFDDNLSSLVYGTRQTIGGEYIYFYINASLEPIKSTTKILSIMLLFATLFSVMIALCLAFYISKKLSAPIINLTNSAKTLSNGNLNVVFSASGFKELDTLSNTLNYATQELRATENLRKDLISNVTHELRTPLTIIKAYAELIKDVSGNDNIKRNEHINVILNESDKLNNLVNDILDLSKMQSKTINYDFKRFSLSFVTQRVITTFGNVYTDFTFANDIEQDLFIFGDESRIEQVIVNLIANAINYSKDDKTITIVVKREGDSIVLKVTDKGIGIKQEDIENVFDKFFRSEESKRTTVGSGIGLAIVKEILIAHNFEYGVTSEIGKGSTFYVIFNEKNKIDER